MKERHTTQTESGFQAFTPRITYIVHRNLFHIYS